MDKALCTVLMPVYNGEKYIARALDSVSAQKTEFGYKLWIINDGSTDNSLEIIMSYERKFKQKGTEFIVFDRPHAGNTVNMLFAYRKINTKYFAVLDQDDYWIIDNKLQMAVRYMEENARCSVFANNFFVQAEGTEERYPYLTKADFNAETAYDFNMQTSSAVFRYSFTPEYLDTLTRYIGTPDEEYLGHDNFRNYYHFTKGYMRIDGTMGSVYSINSAGAFASLLDTERDTACAFAHLFFYEYITGITDKDTGSLLDAAWYYYTSAVYRYTASFISRAAHKEKTDTGSALKILSERLSAYPRLPQYNRDQLYAVLKDSGNAYAILTEREDTVNKYKELTARCINIIRQLSAKQ